MLFLLVLSFAMVIGTITALFYATGSVWVTLFFVALAVVVGILGPDDKRKLKYDSEAISFYYLIGYPVSASVLLLVVAGLFSVLPPPDKHNTIFPHTPQGTSQELPRGFSRGFYP